MYSSWQVTTICCVLILVSCRSLGYELHDTIHNLEEENIHLQLKLENLTHALRDLKHLLTEHSKVSGGRRDTEFLHAWKEWTQHGLSPETHQMLKQALCLPELHGASKTITFTPCFLLLSLLLSAFPFMS